MYCMLCCVVMMMMQTTTYNTTGGQAKAAAHHIIIRALGHPHDDGVAQTQTRKETTPYCERLLLTLLALHSADR